MFRLWKCVFAALAVCAGAPALADPPPLEAYSRGPTLDQISLSPSGTRAAYVMPVADGRRIVLQEVGKSILATVSIGRAKLRSLSWAGDDFLVVTTSATYDLGPDFAGSKWEIDSAQVLNLKTLKLIDVFHDQRSIAKSAVFGFDGAASVGGRWYGYFGGVTLERAISNEDILTHTYPDLYRVDLETGKVSLEAKGSESMAGWLVAPDGNVLAHVEYFERSGEWRLLTGGGAGGKLAARRQAPLGDVALLGQGRTPGTALILDRTGDIAHLQEISLADGKTEELLADTSIPDDDEFGVNYIFDRTSGLFLGSEAEDPQGAVLFDPARQAKLKGAFKAFPKYRTRLVSYDPSFDAIIMETDGADDSGTFWFVDIPKGSADPIGQARPDIPADQVGPTRMYDYKAADGTAMQGVLTLPPGKTAKGLPLVMMPHGGPLGFHDEIRFDWWAQAFASRGYAVFQPNFRGSSGYGTSFERAGYGEWGRGMLSDIADGLAALAKDGVVDPKRACIVGASYGGYAALAGVTLQHGLYRCAVSYAGVSDMPGLRNWDQERSDEGDNATVRSWKVAIRGDSKDAPGLSEISPLHAAAKADAPILLIHGKDDTVVPIDQSRKMASALRGAGKPVDLIEFDGQDHWLSQEASRVQMLKAAVEFVLKNNPPG
jgi:dipeptidyl aminopeptidase/acylaminoacyl peptidase